MRIVGVNLADDAAIAVLNKGELEFVGEVAAVSYDPPGAEAPADGFATALARHGVFLEDVEQFVLTGSHGGHIFRPQHYAVEYFGDLDAPEEVAGNMTAEKEGEGRIGGSLVRYTSRRYVAAQAAGAFSLYHKQTKGSGAILAVTWTPRTPMRAYRVTNEGAIERVGEDLLDFTSAILTVIPYYFGPLKREDVIEGRRDFLTEQLTGNARDAERTIAFAAYGTPHDGLDEVLRKAAARVAEDPENKRRAASVAAAWAEHSILAGAALYCREKGVGDISALATIYRWLDREAARGVTRLLAVDGASIVFAGGGLATNRIASAMRAAARAQFRPFETCPIQGGALAAVGAATLEWWKRGRYRAIGWRSTCGPQFENFFARVAPSSNPEEIADLIADNPSEPVVVVYGHAAIGPRSLGRRSVFGHPAVADSLFKINRFRAQNARGDVTPTALDLIVLDEFSAGFFEQNAFDEFAQYMSRATEALLRAAPAVVGVDRLVIAQTVPAWGDHFLLRVLRRFHERTGLPFLASVALRRPDGGEYLTTGAVIEAAKGHDVRHAWVDYSLFDTRAKENEDES